jgi:hypothetical protein
MESVSILIDSLNFLFEANQIFFSVKEKVSLESLSRVI